MPDCADSETKDDGVNPYAHLRDRFHWPEWSEEDIPSCRELADVWCLACIFEEGQQNPDPKQYAKREELVEVFEKKLQTIETGSQVGTAIYNSYSNAVIIIRTHGLKKKEE